MDTIKKIQFTTQPIMFIGWPDLGNVGILAIDYIRKKLNAEPFAKIDLSETIVNDVIIVKDGVASYPALPEFNFYFKKNPDVIIFESNARISEKEGVLLIHSILKIASYMNVKYIFTAGGITKSMSLSDKIDIKFVSNNEDTQKFLYTYGFDPLPYGEISGLNGTLFTAAFKKGFNIGCFLGTVPAYAYNWIIAYPKASLEIIKIFSSILGVSIDYAEFYEDTKSINEILEVIDAQMQESIQNEHSKEMQISPPAVHQQYKKDVIPNDVVEKIEQLFRKASHNKSLVMELKQELDKWKLFQKYEKRFLGLFKR